MQVIFDLNHLAYRCFFACRNDIMRLKDEDLDGYKFHHNMMFNTIIKLARRFEADQVILCVDHKLNWRKKVFPDYKAQRKAAKEKDDMDWDEFYAEFEKFVDYCRKFFPFYVLQVKYLEADDIAAVLAKTYQREKKIIITSDTDYIQLLRYKNVRLFDPIKNTFRKESDPVRALKIKCLMGDRSDNIPAIKPRVGAKTAEKIADEPELLKEIFDHPELGDEYKENYKRNIRLIDLNRIPDKLVERSIKLYQDYDLPAGNRVFEFLGRHKFRDLQRKEVEIGQLIESLRHSEPLFG